MTRYPASSALLVALPIGAGEMRQRFVTCRGEQQLPRPMRLRRLSPVSPVSNQLGDGAPCVRMRELQHPIPQKQKGLTELQRFLEKTADVERLNVNGGSVIVSSTVIHVLADGYTRARSAGLQNGDFLEFWMTELVSKRIPQIGEKLGSVGALFGRKLGEVTARDPCTPPIMPNDMLEVIRRQMP
jgi:hypothetical protein